jgi:hypothetical protein
MDRKSFLGAVLAAPIALASLAMPAKAERRTWRIIKRQPPEINLLPKPKSTKDLVREGRLELTDAILVEYAATKCEDGTVIGWQTDGAITWHDSNVTTAASKTAYLSWLAEHDWV